MPPRPRSLGSNSKSLASQSPRTLATPASLAAEASGSSDKAHRSVSSPCSTPELAIMPIATTSDKLRAMRGSSFADSRGSIDLGSKPFLGSYWPLVQIDLWQNYEPNVSGDQSLGFNLGDVLIFRRI